MSTTDPPESSLQAKVTASGAHAVAVNAGAGASVSVDNATGTRVQGDVEALQQVTMSGGYVENLINQQVIQQPFHPAPPPTAEAIAAAQAWLAALPTDQPPAPQESLPPGSWMGQLSRNHQFVGREADLCALASALKGGAAVAVHQAQAAVASGMGGIGKTQLAVEFAYRYGNYFAGVFWLSFAHADTIEAEIARCGGAGHLQLFTEAAGLKLAEQANLVRARWACGLPYLLIFDNCEEPELVRQYHPGGAARVLITSRTPDWPGHLGVQRHALDVLSRGESSALLRQHRPDLADADADMLAAELGDLPLALHLAGRFLVGPGKILTVERYLTELRSPRLFARLPAREPLPTGHDRDVFRTFALSYERLDPQEAEAALALRLLARTAHLVPGEVIPADLLRATLESDTDDLDGQLAAEAALERLIALGLLERETDAGLRMHRLVGSYVRQVSGDSEALAAVEGVVMARAETLTDAPTLAPITAFLPILRGVTDAALMREDAEAAMLCIWLGQHLDRLGSYALAQPYVECALALSEHILGIEHPQTITSLSNLAGLLESQGRYEMARPLYERALALCERVLGPEHPQTALSLNNLAYLYQSQGHYEMACALYKRALALNERVLGPEHPKTLTSLNNLAFFYEAQEHYDAACLIHERALAVRERVLGPEHPDTAVSINNLAAVYQNQGHYSKARLLFERALDLSERVLGPEHPDTASSLANLAGNCFTQGEYAAAADLIRRAISIYERKLGPDHPDTMESRHFLVFIEAQLAVTITLPSASTQIAQLTQEAEEAVAQALVEGRAAQRAALAQRLGDIAGRIERNEQGEAEGSPYRALAAHLRTLMARLEASEPPEHTQLRQRAEAAVARALAEGSAEERADLSQRLRVTADAYAGGQASTLALALAAQLRALAERLGEAG